MALEHLAVNNGGIFTMYTRCPISIQSVSTPVTYKLEVPTVNIHREGNSIYAIIFCGTGSVVPPVKVPEMTIESNVCFQLFMYQFLLNYITTLR